MKRKKKRNLLDCVMQRDKSKHSNFTPDFKTPEKGEFNLRCFFSYFLLSSACKSRFVKLSFAIRFNVGQPFKNHFLRQHVKLNVPTFIGLPVGAYIGAPMGTPMGDPLGALVRSEVDVIPVMQ